MSSQILIIEDEEQVRENVAEWLRLNGFSVETAPDGKQGITQAILARPDLILCDIMMPNMDGLQVLETIRTNRSLANTPFMFLTAKSDLKDLRFGMAMGADDYLTKPFTGESLLQAVESRITREELRKASLQAQLTEQHLKIAQISGNEYNTSLDGVIGMSTFLINHLDEFESEDMVSMLEMIRVCGLRLKRSVQNLTLVETLQLLNPSHPDYRFYTNGSTFISANLIKEQFRLVENRQDLKISCRVNVKETKLGISEENLITILQELLDNAAKYSDPSGITIDGYPEGEGYRLIISNKGPMFRLVEDTVLKTSRQLGYDRAGCGLGLIIVKKLVELNQGSISIAGYPDGSTKAMVWLPSR
ncbi:hybrid sensor histidine kinase/response regulator [Larkinella rosea]|uniref:histidine kinase n=2 Tax=Larkinella rosea TaxID=2025312 RepID=A0A3P1C3D9_9BACT|nr:hybrid sensor histidine kinase/response regulator [Larkinella rosea]